MNINKTGHYVIVKKVKGMAVEYFNNRVYLGKYVKSAYTQIPNKEEYTICQVRCVPVNDQI